MGIRRRYRRVPASEGTNLAVTLSLEQLMVEMRLSQSPEETSIATRLLDTCTDMVELHLGSAYAGARESAVNEAVILLSGYLFDKPTASQGDGFANAMRNSGAGRVLLPYRVHRAGYADTVEAANEAVGSTDNPVTGIDVTGPPTNRYLCRWRAQRHTTCPVVVVVVV